jgi:hypothetical protein
MLYYKIIDDQEVISQCKSLKIDGRWVSNPTQEQIFADGWQVYTPPPFVPQPQDEPDYEQVVEAVKKMFSTDTDELSDEEALDVAALYPTWRSKIGQQVAVGERLWDDGKLWKVIQPHTVQEDWRPADAVSLFVEVSIEEWPEWRQPVGAHDAYNAGDQVSHNGSHWRSNCDGNIWEPGVFGWDEV